ncbi:glutamate-5-semialdehyde dehydrogenase [Thalassoglobus sp. JC818]|uniref:glutamate-5-semialdehyde dehydrogenase n=1 Tax=Thalassoglobus sp. JC818 TaxID=3232136 RepID=UPI00345932D2
MNDNLEEYVSQVAHQAKAASRALVTTTGGRKNDWLRLSAERIRSQESALLAENERDIAKAPEFGLTSAQIDRLRLTPERLEGIAQALEEVAQLPDPIGEIIDSNPRPNGLLVTKVRVPLGVVFFIYESRPNVTVDAAALCVKSGNAVILRGGKEAFHSNMAFYRLLSETLGECGLPQHAVQLVETTDRAAVGAFLKCHESIDVAIPRGGKSLIERVTQEATMPVIKHFDGVCHVYVDRSADLQVARDILINSKCHRTGVCNAAESFLVHEEIADEFLKLAGPALLEKGVEIRSDDRVRSIIPEALVATEEDYRTEYLDLKISAKVVNSIDEAIEHINEYGSHHTDVIVTTNFNSARRFTSEVDSAAVLVNASTRFNDGGEFGLGAEIGISTDKFHARGPCGLKELTSYKYVAYGDGQIR